MINTKDNLPDKPNQLSVDIIASGYEWICPICGHYQKEIEVLEIVTCNICGESFFTNPPEHAMG
jgi:rubrerythrin